MNICDNCGREVSPHNDARIFEVCLQGDPPPMFGEALFPGISPRHLLPVVIDGQEVCGGSPSRAQYLPGQPRDTRPKFSYDSSWEAAYRAAYKLMLSIT
jgi:hypothetical protein